MNPQEIFCPNKECSASGQIGKGNIRNHSRNEERTICQEWGETFTSRKGTIYFRLRTPAERARMVVPQSTCGNLLAYSGQLNLIISRLESKSNHPVVTINIRYYTKLI
jgi:hypothetical protein